MQRNPDLLREILLDIEGKTPAEAGKPLDIENYSPEEIWEHLRQLEETGLVERHKRAGGWPQPSSFPRRPDRLTSTGHDVLDEIREPARWTRLKSLVAKGREAAIKAGFSTLASWLAEKVIS